MSREELAVTLVCAGKVGRQEESPGWRTAGLARGQWKIDWGTRKWTVEEEGQGRRHTRKTRGQERTVEEDLRTEKGSEG